MKTNHKDTKEDKRKVTKMQEDKTRRDFLLWAPAGAGILVPALAAAQKKAEEEEVSPAEDLMREHGVLNRILLIYDEIERRLSGSQEVAPEPLAAAAKIIQRFIEQYHEKLEEDHIFPRFEKAGKLVELVRVLRQQHVAGRTVTDRILQLSTAAGVKQREDTVLFPALHQIVSKNEFDAMGEDFEKKENELLGAEGFERVVDEVAALEKKLGLYDLGQFTPRA